MIETFRKLEVGKLAVSAIRDGMSLLHDFNSALTTRAAEFTVSQFGFAHGREKGSDMAFPNFMQQCTSYMQQFSTGLQLVIIISDGRLNKAKVRPYVRLS
jgi:midasin (ATPase involved in ribosome maturation)